VLISKGEIKTISRVIEIKKRHIQAMQKRPLRNLLKIRREKKSVAALTEAGRDTLNTAITTYQSTVDEVDKNNYASYGAQVEAAYKMYEAKSRYGAEVFGGIVDIYNSFLAGEGISVTASKPAAQKYIDRFFEHNKLNGSRLMDMILTGSLEGKDLVRLYRNNDKKMIDVASFSWHYNRYIVITQNGNKDKIVKVVYKPKGDIGKEKTLPADSLVFVRLGGTEFSVDETPNRFHRVLTDCENYSRAKYDLRKNTHLFGNVMPNWKTEAGSQEAKAITNALESKEWIIGDGYAGPAEFRLIEPTGSAADAILKDMLSALKVVSMTTGIPIHFLAYPELMSNRATADNLLELVAATTKKDRLIWEEAFREIIEKSMEMAVNNQYETNDILGADINVKLPMVSLSLLKQVIEVWYPLLQDDIISIFTFMNMLPGIDPSKELRQIERDKKKRAEESPFNNGALNETLLKMQNNNKNGEIANE